jgi:dipeptidyl aminopeptidase/acylaminoacyl peptidase
MSVAFSPDGTTLASGSEDNTAKIWNLETGKEITTLKGHSHYVNSVAFSPDGKLLATGSADSTAKVWTIATGEARTLKEHSGVVSSVAFSPDGQKLATASADKTVKIWDLSTGKVIRTLNGHSEWVRSVAFSPDGQRLATGSDDATAKVWDWENGRALVTLEGHSEYGVGSVAFSPDGKRLATGSQDWTVKIWDIAPGESMLTLEGHNYAVSNVVFSPDGKRLATGSEDATAKIWELDAANIAGKMQRTRRLAPLTEPQLEAWSLDELLDMKSGNEPFLRDTREPWQIAAFADLYAQKAGNDRAARLYEYALENGSPALKKHIARKYNDLGARQLFIPDGKAAETSLRRGIDLDPANPDLPANLAHALLLQGRFAEAEKMYRTYKDQPYKGETYGAAFLNTLKSLEGQGVSHPDMARARALLEAGGM